MSEKFGKLKNSSGIDFFCWAFKNKMKFIRVSFINSESRDYLRIFVPSLCILGAQLLVIYDY